MVIAEISFVTTAAAAGMDFDKLPTALQVAGFIGVFIGSVVTVILGLRAKNRPPDEAGATGGVGLQLLRADVDRHENDIKELKGQLHDVELEQARMGGRRHDR